MRMGRSAATINHYSRSKRSPARSASLEHNPKLKRVANKVKNARRIGFSTSAVVPPSPPSSRVKEPRSPIYSVARPTTAASDESKSQHSFGSRLRSRLSRLFSRRRHNVRYLAEMREISKKMKPVEKARDFCPLPCLQPTREYPIWHKVKARHLELEPLCSFSSCVVRGGCVAIIVSELIYVACTALLILSKLYNGGNVRLWREFHWNFNSVVTHPFFLYLVLIFDGITLLMACVLIRGILRFQRLYAKLHWQFDFFALAFNVIAFSLYVVALSSNGPSSWSVANIGLAVCFGLQIPIQAWAIRVCSDCWHFFNMLYVLIMIAE